MTLPSDTTAPGIPWWAAGMAGGAAAAVLATRPRQRKNALGP